MYTFVCVSTRPTLITTVCVKRYARAPASLSLSFFCIDTPPPWSDDNLNSARAHTPSVCVCAGMCELYRCHPVLLLLYTTKRVHTTRTNYKTPGTPSHSSPGSTVYSECYSPFSLSLILSLSLSLLCACVKMYV